MKKFTLKSVKFKKSFINLSNNIELVFKARFSLKEDRRFTFRVPTTTTKNSRKTKSITTGFNGKNHKTTYIQAIWGGVQTFFYFEN